MCIYEYKNTVTIYMYINILEHTATHCNTPATHLQREYKRASVVDMHTSTLLCILQHTAIHCNKLQHTATHSNALQHTCNMNTRESLW